MNINLLHGDCLELTKDIPDKSVDMILCDLPYGTTACKWDTVIPFEPLWEQYERVIKDNGAIVLFGSQPFTTKLINSNIDIFRYELIWEKERPTNIYHMKNQPGKVHENMLIFYKKQPTYNPIKEPAKQPKNNHRGNKSQSGEMNTLQHLGVGATKISDDYDGSVRNPRSVLKVNRSTRNSKKLHPTQKPVELMEYLIKTYTNEGETVLDNCMGSGTTGVACINTNRNFIGMELDDKYFEIAQQRISDAQEKLKEIE